MPTVKHEYDLYCDGNYLMTGTVQDIRHEVGCASCAVATAAMRGYLVRGHYRITYHIEPERKKEDSEDPILETMRIYGNTIVHKNPEEECERLRKLGINCSYKEISDDKSRAGMPGHKRIVKKTYLIEEERKTEKYKWWWQ